MGASLGLPDFYIEGIPVYVRYMDESQRNYPAKYMDPKYITVHETENYEAGANALMHSNYLLNEAYGRYASWQFSVDDVCIIQHAPTSRTCWHAGDGPNGPGNTQSIGIEHCENKDGDFQKTVSNGQALVRYLMDKENLSISRIKPHHHWSGKNCPGSLLLGWDTYIDQIKTGNKPLFTKPIPQVNTNYSLVDYLKSVGKDSSWTARISYAEQYKISNYRGTPEQNLELLAKMQQERIESIDPKTDSIVDYLNKKGIDSSFSNRAKLAAKYGIVDYEGSATQNLELLLYMSGKKTVPSPKKAKSVHLPAGARSWRTYKLNVRPIKENSDWSLTPSIYGGLTYRILAKPYENVVTIETGRGKRNIYIGPDTGAKIIG